MRLGDLVAKRFRIRDRAGAGGMGVVFRAEDLQTGEPVALKVLFPNQRPERFLREAGVLAEISHPAIVRYVAHGVTDSGQVYLAMEWLEGESLSALVAERRLSFGECMVLLRRVCNGLAIAHEKGVVHRDVKPGNILLPEGSLAAAKLIDFGIARRRLDPRITERGLLVGTLAYMSPEQARGVSDVEPASDVFSLGSVVYKCLTGDSPFGGGDAPAVLAKVLLDEPTPLVEIVPELPRAFDALVGRMLSKEPAIRPRDAGAVLELVSQVAAAATTEHTAPGITSREQRVVWIALVNAETTEETETRDDSLASMIDDPETELAARVAQTGGRFDSLADGTRIASFAGGGVPRDEAVRAVHIAEELRVAFPNRPVAVASGLGVVGGRAPVGDAIDRGTALLARARGQEIYLDAATANLVGAEFEVAPDAVGLRLIGVRHEADSTRKLLGRPTTCVGRERELETLDALLDECMGEPVARAAIVLGPAGVGKSRLRYEFVNRARERVPELAVFAGRAASVSAGSPFSLLRQAIRASADILDGEPLAESRAKLRARIERTPGHDEKLDRMSAFLGELAGVPFPEESEATLRAVRENPTLLGDAMKSAWIDFLARETAAGPVMLVLEDLHWGDIPTASFVDAALAALPDAPLYVLALGRPELHDALPKLWARRDPQELRLGPLRKQASAALAREVLGAGVAARTVDRIVELSDGNAFFLEELIRAVSEGREDLPETVLGMMQARLESLGSEARRVLRAASIFGAVFWRGGVTALLGSDADPRFVESELDALAALELISRRPSQKLAGEAEFIFRHSMLEETVHSTLTPDDKKLGHRLAGEWLERSGTADAVALAEHFRLGELPERAANWYLLAAKQALEGADLAAVLDRVERALACNPDPETRGELHYLAGDAHFWRGEYLDSERHLHAAVEDLPVGSARWFVSIGALVSTVGTLGKDDELYAWAERTLESEALSEEARAAQIVALVRASHGHLKHGKYAQADVILDRAEALAATLDELTALGQAWVHHGRSARAYYDGNVGSFMREVEASIEGFDAVGDWRTGGNARANLGYAALSLGDMDRAEQLLREAMSLTDRLGMAGIGHYVMHNLGLVLAYRGQAAEAEHFERRAIEEAETRGEMLLVGAAHLYLSIILRLGGDLDGALKEARTALTAGSSVPILRAQSLAAEAEVLVAKGEADDALGRATEAVALLEEHGGSDETEGRVRCALANALVASGRADEARELARRAVSNLRERAARLGDPRLERCFLEGVPDHARLVELAGSEA